MSNPERVKNPDIHWHETVLYIPCPRCNMEGIIIKNGKEKTCPECDGEGVVSKD